MKEKRCFLIAKKIRMTQMFLDDGTVVPVTVLKSMENYVVGKKVASRDGYDAVVLGYNQCEKYRLTRPFQGQFSGDIFCRDLKEFRVKSSDEFELGSKIDPSSFDVDSDYDLRSKTIGRGFSGAIKAWGHQRGPMSHGSKNHRLLGSIGQATTPGRVMKGKKMHTRYGNEFVTMKNLTLVKVDGEYLFFKGAVPGKSNIVYITKGAS